MGTVTPWGRAVIATAASADVVVGHPWTSVDAPTKGGEVQSCQSGDQDEDQRVFDETLAFFRAELAGKS